MGFATSVTQAIFFIASALVAVAIAGIALTSVMGVANSFNAKAGKLTDQIKTEVAIVGDSCYLPSSTYLYARNTGDTVLDANAVDIFLDGLVYNVSAVSIRIDNNWESYSTVNIWAPGKLARFEVTNAFPTGYHKVMVSTEYGIYDRIEYSDC